MNEEEKDVYIKGKIKDGYIPERIDNLVNNSIKIIENKGEIQMEENFNMNQKQEQNQNKPEKKKMPVALKRVLAAVTCLTLLIGGGNVYASTQGYDNIFFLIMEKLGITTDVFGKENILSDRDITISYRPIEIARGTQIQVNNLVIKENEAKLKIQVNESSATESITPLKFTVKDENGTELYSNVQSNPTLLYGDVNCDEEINDKDYEKLPYIVETTTTNLQYKEELVLNNFKEDTKKLILEIYNVNGQKIVDLEIDLEKREINVIGTAEELTKISEEELKQYLGAFAMLNYNGTEYNIEMTENEKKTIAALLIAENKATNVDAGLYSKNGTDVRRVLDKEKVHAFIKSFTGLELDENGVMDFTNSNMFEILTFKKKIQYLYELDSIGCSPTAIEVSNIDYIGGIYNVTFKFCYSTEADKGFESEAGIENLAIYEMSMGLILNEDNEYSKYRVSTMSEVVLCQDKNENDQEIENELQINFENYVGRVWQTKDEQGTLEELLISNISDNRVTFSYYKYRNAKYENLTATLDGNSAKFIIQNENIVGTLTFGKGIVGDNASSNDQPTEFIELSYTQGDGDNLYITEEVFSDSFKYEDFVGGVWKFANNENGTWGELQIREISNGKITFQLAHYRWNTTQIQTVDFYYETASIAYFIAKDTAGNIEVEGTIILKPNGVGINIQKSNTDNWEAGKYYETTNFIKYEDFIGGVWVHEGENGEQFEIIISDINNDQITCELLSYRNISYGKQTANFGWDTKSMAYFDFRDGKTGRDSQFVDIGLILDVEGLSLYTQGSTDYNLEPSKTYNELKHIKYEDYVKTWKNPDGNLEMRISKIDQTGIELELIIDGKSYGIINEQFGFESAAFTVFDIKDESGMALLNMYMDLRKGGLELNITHSNIKSIKAGKYNLEAK